MLQPLEHLMVVLVLMLELLDLVMVLFQVVFERFHSLAQANDFRLQNFDNWVVGY